MMAVPASWAPELTTPSRPTAAVVRVVKNSAYEAGANTSRTRTWRAPTTTPNAGVLGNLLTLRDRSRAAVRNDGFAKGIIDTLVCNLIGDGIKPLSQAEDKAFRKALHAKWNQWECQSDPNGLSGFYGQQTLIARSWLEGGEVFIRLRPRLATDGLSVPLQLQVFEPELCPHTYNAILPSGNLVKAGIEFNKIGQRVAYWFYRQRPGDPDYFDMTTLARVPADEIIHLFEELRPGQLRGIPHLTPALVQLVQISKISDAMLLRHETQNLFGGFITRPAGLEGDDINPITGQSMQDGESSDVSLEPGGMRVLDPGEEITFSNPPGATPGYADFMQMNLRAACASTQVPYELVTGDMRALSDRVMRVLLNEFRRQIQAKQHQLFAHRLCGPVFRTWLDRAYMVDALPFGSTYFTDPSPWNAVKWMPPKWAYIHPVQDVQAQKEAILVGLESRQSVVAQNGEDAEAIDAEQAADNERADGLGLTYTSDARQQKTTPASTGAAA
jgi:lambda family phage portal protein